MRRWSMFWGLVLIVVGSLLLMDNLGFIAFDVWLLVGPVMLVVLGFWVLLAKPARADSVEGERLSIPSQGATRAKVSLRHGAGKLHLRSGADSGELLSGTFGGGVSHRTKMDGTDIKARLKGPSEFSPFARSPASWRAGLNWDIAFNAEIALSIDCRTGASENSYDLRGLKVEDLALRCGASEVTIWLPEAAGKTRVDIRGGMGSIIIHVPENVAARISISSGLSGISVDPTRFPKQHGVYESPDYATAANSVEIRLRTGVSSVEIS